MVWSLGGILGGKTIIPSQNAFFGVPRLKVGFYLKAVLGFNAYISFAFQAIEKLFIYVLRSFVNFWVIFGDIWEEIVFLNGLVKFREIRNGEDLI